MKRIAFFVNSTKRESVEMRAVLARRAAALGLEVTEDASGAEAVVALGGDGTFLRAAHSLPGLPLLGLNLGGLGYLASVGRRDFARALRMLAKGRFSISERALLEVRGGHRALNDIVISRDLGGHSARLDLEADGRLVTRYMADGLIVASPTGSTAYSLSAGGPVLLPDSQSIVVTPMNPHALGVRPVVFRDTVSLNVAMRTRTEGNRLEIGVYADGERVASLGEGESVRIFKSKSVARLVELEGYDPYEVLAHKLGWSGSNVR